MTGNNNFDMPPGQPDDERDIFDEIDKAVERITNAEIDDSLKETLRRAGYGPYQDFGTDLGLADFPCPQEDDPLLHPARALADAARPFWLMDEYVIIARREAEKITAAAREEADKIIADAHQKARCILDEAEDTSLVQATLVASHSGDQAERILSDAHHKAGQILRHIRHKAERVLTDSRHKAARILGNADRSLSDPSYEAAWISCPADNDQPDSGAQRHDSRRVVIRSSHGTAPVLSLDWDPTDYRLRMWAVTSADHDQPALSESARPFVILNICRENDWLNPAGAGQELALRETPQAADGPPGTHSAFATWLLGRSDPAPQAAEPAQTGLVHRIVHHGQENDDIPAALGLQRARNPVIMAENDAQPEHHHLQTDNLHTPGGPPRTAVDRQPSQSTSNVAVGQLLDVRELSIDDIKLDDQESALYQALERILDSSNGGCNYNSFNSSI